MNCIEAQERFLRIKVGKWIDCYLYVKFKSQNNEHTLLTLKRSSMRCRGNTLIVL